MEPVDDERGKDPGATGSWTTPAEGGGGVKGCRQEAVPKRGRQGAGRLRLLLRVRLQPPGWGLLPWAAVLLRFGPGTSCSQLHYRSIDVYSLL
jgi:hypothetical protein